MSTHNTPTQLDSKGHTKGHNQNHRGIRIGYGEDAHKLTEGRSLVVAGVRIPESPRGALAHSDGDVVLHALADALLSAFALGDIGQYFPPSDPKWRDMDSQDIVQAVKSIIVEKSYALDISNVAIVVTLDVPKLGKHRSLLQSSLMTLLELPEDAIGITFKTSEGLAPDHIQARVSLLAYTKTL
ncbi:MAG: 2-C-methyl-D-erythritol 2,4-cyclodiphosphate synthase [Deinococcota bacterium]